MSALVDESCVLVDGPWTHRFVSANGSRFHVVEAGTGPLVLFLHGFPEFWWAWHQVLPEVADAGFRAVAVDMRGYGASDKPPRGYDGYTMAADVTGLIRALGERSAVIVGAGFGGMIGWTAAAFHPRMVRRLVVMGAAHPLRLRAALVADPRGQFTAAAPTLKFQVPRYEHVLTRNDAAMVGQFLRRWGGAPWVDGPAFAEYEQPLPGGDAASRRRRSARWRRTAGRSGRCCGCAATASCGSCSSRSSRRRCTCTARWTRRSCPVRRRGPAATSSPRTSGACSTASATSRTWSPPTTSPARSSAGPSPDPTPVPSPRRSRTPPSPPSIMGISG